MVMFVRSVRDALRLLGERKGRWVVLVVLALVVTAFEAVGASLIYVLMGLVSGEGAELSLPVVGNVRELFPDTPLQNLQLWMAAMVGLFFLIRTAVVIGQQYLQARLVHNAAARLANHLVRGYLEMPYLQHTLVNSSELVRNAFDSVQTLVRQVMKPAVEIVAELVLVVGLTIVLVVVAPQATLIALLVMVPTVWLLLRVVQPRLKLLGRQSQESRKDSLQAMQQALGGIRDIRILGVEDQFANIFAHNRRIMSRTDYVKIALSELPRALIETALVLVIVAVFLVAVIAGEGMGAVVSTLGVFAYAGLRLQPSLRHIVSGLNHVRFGSAVIEDLLSDRHRVDAVLAERRTRQAISSGGTQFKRAIELRGVTFSYDTAAAPALRDVSLTIQKGQFVGICGPTGGGKSTLIDLIAGLLEPTTGEVLVDGAPLGPHPNWWYGELGVVSQSVFLTDDTLRRNIAFGRSDKEIDEERLQLALARAQLLEVVAGLPDGLDTIVGERGVRLSGGQRQRVAVARALYREPSVIIFDEGTSALDAVTEAALVASIDGLKTGRTLISVAHRISTVRRADRLFVIQGGRIVADGAYDDLLHVSEAFRSLAL